MAISRVNPTASGVQSKKTQTITSSTTWTVPTGVTSVDVTCIGAAASIGGAGAVIKATIDTSSIQGTGIPVTIGQSPAAAAYGKGGDTQFGSFITSGGGFSGDNLTAGVSGTRFIAGTAIPATSNLKSFISNFGTGDSNQQFISYNSTIGLYITSGQSPNNNAEFFYYTSPDLNTWTRRSITLVNPVIGSPRVYSANNRFFMTFRDSGQVGYFKSSTDGINWSTILRTYPSGTAQSEIYNVIYSPNSAKYYFLGDWNGTYHGLVTSVSLANVATTDTSFEQSINTTSGGTLSGFIFNGSNLGISFAVNYSAGGTYNYSLFNGTTWAAYVNCTNLSATFSANSNIYPQSGAWDGTKFTISDNKGNLFTTTNLTTWTPAGVTIAGLFIQGFAGGYYYGSIGRFYAYSTNGTTWTKTSIFLNNQPSFSQQYKFIQNSTTLASVSNTTVTGLIESFNIASPNTTVAPGLIGKWASAAVIAHGGAGGSGNVGYQWNGSSNQPYLLDSAGVDGYGVVTSSSILAAQTYGSTNGAAGNSGAVILSWLQ